MKKRVRIFIGMICLLVMMVGLIIPISASTNAATYVYVESHKDRYSRSTYADASVTGHRCVVNGIPHGGLLRVRLVVRGSQELVLSPGTFGGYVVADSGNNWISGQTFNKSFSVSNSNYVMKFSEHQCLVACTIESCKREDSRLYYHHVNGTW